MQNENNVNQKLLIFFYLRYDIIDYKYKPNLNLIHYNSRYICALFPRFLNQLN